MRTLVAFSIAAVLSASLVVTAQSRDEDEVVTLSAVVFDKAGVPVRDLTAKDFSVRENGRPVSNLSVSHVGAGNVSRGKAVTLVLGGASGGTSPDFTPRVQMIANDFLELAGPNDRVSVVRYAQRRTDEMAGDLNTMRMRVAEYRADRGEPLNTRMVRDVLELVGKLSREMQDIDAPRRALVLIGLPAVFDPIEPVLREHQIEWPAWTAALTAAARANVSVYVIDPHGLQGYQRVNPDGLVAQTGGTVYYNRNDIDKWADLIWNETASYYALEYTPGPARRDLQKIEVKVSNPSLVVRARRSR